MIVQCENCNTRFRLADEKVGPRGVRVRCSKCKHAFVVTLPEAQKAPEATPAPAAPFPPPPTPPQPPPSAGGAAAAAPMAATEPSAPAPEALVFDATPVDDDFISLAGHTVPEAAAPQLSRAARAPEPPASGPSLSPEVATAVEQFVTSDEVVIDDGDVMEVDADDGVVMIDDTSVVSADAGTFQDPFAPRADDAGSGDAAVADELDDDDLGEELDRTAVYSVAVDLSRRAGAASDPAAARAAEAVRAAQAVQAAQAATEAAAVAVGQDASMGQPQAISFEELDPFAAAAQSPAAAPPTESPFAAHAAGADPFAAHATGTDPFAAHAAAATAPTAPETSPPLAAHAEIAAQAPTNLSEDLFGDLSSDSGAVSAPQTPSAEPLIPGPAPLDPTPATPEVEPPRASVLGLVANGLITLGALAVLLAGLAYFVLGNRLTDAMGGARTVARLPTLDDVRITSMRLLDYPRASGSELLVATGTVKNESERGRDDLYVVAHLSGNDGKVEVEARAPLGVALEPGDLAGLTDAESLRQALLARARALGDAALEAGAEQPYTIVFIEPPDIASELTPTIELEKGNSFEIPEPPQEPEPEPTEVEPEPESQPEPTKFKRKGKKKRKRARRKAAGDESSGAP